MFKILILLCFSEDMWVQDVNKYKQYNSYMGSISSTFFAHIFCMKANWAAFLSLEFGFEQTHTKNVRVKCWWNW